MKSIAKSAMLMVVLAALAAANMPASAQQKPCEASPQLRNDMIRLYKDPQDGECYWTRTSVPEIIDDPSHPGNKTGFFRKISDKSAAVRTEMIRRRVLENYAEFLSPLRLPRGLRLFASDCTGKGPSDSPHYDSQLDHRWMNLCYGMMAGFSQNLAVFVRRQDELKLPTPVSLEQLKAGLYAAVLIHETGHALFDLLDVPMFGAEEDAADQMAALVVLQFGRDTARTAIKGFAYLWKMQAMLGADPGAQADANEKDVERRCLRDPFCGYADVHGTASQRMYNTICMAYGAHPDWFEDFVASNWLPKERRDNCKGEYEQAAKAFVKTVYPFLDQAQMEVVKKRQWFEPSELKER